MVRWGGDLFLLICWVAETARNEFVNLFLNELGGNNEDDFLAGLTGGFLDAGG